MLPISTFQEFPGSPICKDKWFKPKNNYLSKCYEKNDIIDIHQHRDSIKFLFSSIKNQNLNKLNFFDTTPFLCESNYCTTYKQGSYIYHDSIHLSAESKKWLVDPLIKYIENLK